MEHICKICSKSFKFESGLWRHLQIHKASSVMCECGRSFSRRDSLNRHRESSSACKIYAANHETSSDDTVTGSNPPASITHTNSVFKNSHEKTTLPEPIKLKDYLEEPENDVESSTVSDHDDSDTSVASSVHVTKKIRKCAVPDDSDTYSDKSSVHVTRKNRKRIDRDSQYYRSSVSVTRKNRKSRRRRLEKLNRIRRLRKVRHIHENITDNPKRANFSNMALNPYYNRWKVRHTHENLAINPMRANFSKMPRYPYYNTVSNPYRSDESLFNQL
jgi:hypothetical protein